MSARHEQIVEDPGIPDLVRNLTQDSRRLVRDEVRLARLEVRENLRQAARGGMWMGIAFGLGVVALAAFAILLALVLGAATGNLWLGSLLTGAVFLAAAYLLVRTGKKRLGEAPYTMDETREAMKF